MRTEQSSRLASLLLPRQLIAWLGGSRYRVGALILLMLLTGGTVYQARGATQACKDINNVTICFDTEVDLSPLLNKPSFRYEGNVTIARKGQAALLKLTPRASGLAPGVIHVVDGSAVGVVKFGLSIIGGLQFVNEANAAPLLTTIETIEATCPAFGNKVEGSFKIDSVAAKVIVPDPEEFASDFTVTNCPSLIEKPNGFRADFLDNKGLRPLFKDDSVKTNLSAGEYEWDLTARKFNFHFPVNLKLGDATENPNLQINVIASIDEQGKLSGDIDAFKVKIGGLLMSATGVKLTGVANNQPTSFKAATVKVLKVDNPDQPSFDPVDTSVILQFTNLKYNQAKWEIEGVDVGIRDLTFGTAFAMRNNLLGVLNETANGQNIQSIQIKSTMIFGQEGNGIPIILRVGRALDANGQFKPVYQAGLQDSNIKLGTLTFKLKNVTFVGNTAENFWGIKANSADLQWPAQMGGQTAAGVANFKLGINKDLKLQFGLGNGTVGLPPFENKVFRGTLQATIGVVAETMTITGTGTFTIKLAGNNNSAGVAVTAILRYNKDVSSTSAAMLDANTIQASALSASKICIGPGNVIVPCPNDPPPTVPPGPKAFELKLAGFNLKLAGFGLIVTNPRGSDDGGFAADNVGFTLPANLSFTPNSTGGLQIQGLSVSGADGKVSITGGGIDLPTLKVGSLQFNTLKGSFLQLADGNYEFTAGGKLPLLGMEPGPTSPGITVNIKIRANLQTNEFTGAGVTVFFQATPGTGIPIGTTGMEMTGIGGSFDVNNATLTIAVQTKASTQAFIPIINLPIVTIDAGMQLQLNPARFTANASLTLLILQLAQAELQIGNQAGFNGGDGAHFLATVNLVVINGSVEFRAGKITVNGQPKSSLLVQGVVALGIKESTFGPFPRQDRTIASVTITGGRFKDQRNTPTRETAGVKATIDIGIQASVFLDFGKTAGSGGFITFLNLDQVVRFDAVALQAARAAIQLNAAQLSASSVGVNTLTISDEAGNTAEFSSRLMSSEEIQAAAIVLAAEQTASQADGTAQILQESFTRQITQTTKLAIGIFYTGSTPILSLRLPDNTVINESINTATQSFKRITYDNGSVDALFTLDPATPGTYTLLIDNAPVGYEANALYLNLKPQVALSNVTCQGAAISGVTALCTGNPSNIGSAKIDWNASDLDNPDAKVSVGYALVSANAGENTVEASAVDALNIDAQNANQFIPLADGLPLGAGSYTLSFETMPTGKYKVGVMVDDGANVPVTSYSTLVIDVTDKRPPAVPAGLTAVPQAGELLVKWTPNGESDLVGYDIGFGLVNDSNQFVYTRTMGPKVVITGSSNIVDAKLWGLDDNTQIFYGLRAYDISGNYSEWTPLQSATPWAVSPSAWSPVPNGLGEQDVVELAFPVPMDFDSLQDKLTVFDSTGVAVAGSSYYLTNVEGKAIGIGFRPNTALNGAAKATLKGGPTGVKAADGRTMDADYSWSFTLKSTVRAVYLPLANR